MDGALSAECNAVVAFSRARVDALPKAHATEGLLAAAPKALQAKQAAHTALLASLAAAGLLGGAESPPVRPRSHHAAARARVAAAAMAGRLSAAQRRCFASSSRLTEPSENVALMGCGVVSRLSWMATPKQQQAVGVQDSGAPVLPVAAVQEVVAHAEHVAALLSLHAALAAGVADQQRAAATQAAFQLVLSHIGAAPTCSPPNSASGTVVHERGLELSQRRHVSS